MSIAHAPRAEVVVVTGVSGAGKSTSMRALEDLGYSCIDNLPLLLAPQAVELSIQGGEAKVALGIDVRRSADLENVGAVLDTLAANASLDVLFVDASDDVLLRRFSETRRPHALTPHSGPGAASVALGLKREREHLAPLRARATAVLDTSALSVHELRRAIVQRFAAQGDEAPAMRLRFLSFGFKYGIPIDADVLFDVRFLDNPYFVPALRHVPGNDVRVRHYVLSRDESLELIRRLTDLLAYVLPKYQREGKSYLTVAIGCTGGRHRSVVIATELARAFHTHAEHRDMHKGLAGHADPNASGEFGVQREISVQVAPIAAPTPVAQAVAAPTVGTATIDESTIAAANKKDAP